jgi:hypothetical protein
MLVCLSGCATASWSNENQRKFPALFRADVVVRGTVASVSEGGVPTREGEPEHPEATSYLRFKFVDLNVSEVIRGYYNETNMTIGVNLSRSDMGGNYEVGDEMVVSLNFNPKLRGGMYVISSENGRFVREGSVWKQQGEWNEQLSIEQMRLLVKSTSVEAVAKAADCIVIGTITAIRETRINDPSTTGAGEERSCLIWTVTILVERVVAGEPLSGSIEFDMFRGGSYWPRWASVRPNAVKAGEKRLVFLQRVDGRLVAAAGANGYYGINEKGRLQRNAQTLPVSVDQVRALSAEPQR